MINKVVLGTLSTILLFSPVAKAIPVCGFYVDKMVYDHERIETEIKFTKCNYYGSQGMWSSDHGGAWSTIHADAYKQLSGHVTCPSYTSTYINQHESIFVDGQWKSFWFTGSVQVGLTYQQHDSDTQVTYERIPGSGRLIKVWFEGSHDNDPERCPGRGGEQD
ncbi:hypothetical protein [Paraglaciecola sp.]|uniref:hypothetical protein n=1 Tax=Paraglaciecola sp. TaxID=1920173 RepID=UPI0030F45A72